MIDLDNAFYFEYFIIEQILRSFDSFFTSPIFNSLWQKHCVVYNVKNQVIHCVFQNSWLVTIQYKLLLKSYTMNFLLNFFI